MGDVSELVEVSNGNCFESCDGVLPEMFIATVEGPLTTESDSVSITIPGATTYAAFGAESAGEAATSLWSGINGDSEATSLFSVSMEGSTVELIPLNHLSIPNVTVGTEGEGEISLDGGANLLDTRSLVGALFWLLLDATSRFTPQELVDEAITAGDILEDVDEERSFTISVSQMSDCHPNEGGMSTVSLSQEMLVTVDEDELVVGDPALSQLVLDFDECLIDGDWLDNGDTDAFVIFDGMLTWETANDGSLQADLVSGGLELYAEEGDTDQFWTGFIDVSMGWAESVVVGVEDGDRDGGICLGDDVLLGGGGENNSAVDTDDECDDAGVFITASQFFDVFVD